MYLGKYDVPTPLSSALILHIGYFVMKRLLILGLYFRPSALPSLRPLETCCALLKNLQAMVKI